MPGCLALDAPVGGRNIQAHGTAMWRSIVGMQRASRARQEGTWRWWALHPAI